MEIKINLEVLRKRGLFLATPMYGGQCAGMFTKSVADLSAICTKNGIPLQLYFLFNESLITRARSYCVDEFMRSESQHMMFIDSDIGFNPHDVIALMALQANDEENKDYHIIGGAYPKKSVSENSMIETEDGVKPIKWIVDNKYSGKVLSLNESTNEFVWNKVLQHSAEYNVHNKNWVKFVYQNRKKSPTITFDHECAVIKDPMNPKVEYIQAKDITGMYSIRQPNVKKQENVLYNREQSMVLLGTVLGDGYIDGSNNIAINHGHKQKEYVEFKQSMLGGKITSFKGGFATVPGYRLLSPSNAQTKYLRKEIYVDNKKTIKNVINLIDDMALAIWYMDDGTLQYCTSKTKKYPYMKLHTESFSLEDNQTLVSWFKEKYDANPVIDVKEKGKYSKDFYVLRFNVKDSAKIFKKIAKYIHRTMDYKIPSEFHSENKHVYDTKPLGISAVKVEKIEYQSNKNGRLRKSKLYDIGVENCHNFIADGTVVHNCISYEKLKHAVDKGVADKDPSVLEKYVGDFVFNPKHNQKTIQIGEPCEVLEIGTGFMMISRYALEHFRDSYPQYMYKPDHARTEAFDGTREILQAFQAEIDPKTKRYLSEDYWFCQKAQEIGLKVWLCPWMKLQHVGSHIFGGSLADMAALGISPTVEISMLKKKKK